jgi:hypothetical protein
MPTPSLILVPARFKTGKLYTPLATTSGGVVLGASGDFNVTRGTTATRVNANGLIESVASGIPRLDYPLGGGCPALLVEPSAQNLALQSEAFNTTWSPLQLLAFNSGSVINTTGTLDPYGTNVADLIVPNTVSDQHRIDQTTTSVSGSYTFSVFLKAAGYNFGRLRIGTVGATFNLASGTIGSTDAGIVSSIQPFGNGWYRCIVSKAASTANEVIRINVNEALTGDYAGNGTSGIYVFGAQYETGSVATSYIRTTTGSVTRNADVVTLSGAVSGCIGQTEGTIYAEVDIRTSGNTAGIFVISDNTNTNRVYLYKLGTNNRIYAERQSATESATSTLQTSGSITAGIYKIAIAYKSGDTALFVNGVQAGSTNTDTFTMGSIFKLNVGSNRAEATQFNDRIRSAALYTTRLTNAQLAALTTL